jgi:hypothetical protein
MQVVDVAIARNDANLLRMLEGQQKDVAQVRGSRVKGGSG